MHYAKMHLIGVRLPPSVSEQSTIWLARQLRVKRLEAVKNRRIFAKVKFNDVHVIRLILHVFTVYGRY